MSESNPLSVLGVLNRVAYAQIALEQRLTLDQIAQAAQTLSLPMASSDAPDWYVAATSPQASLVDLAPELRAVAGVDERLDLVRMYAPELSTPEQSVVEETVVEEVPAVAPKPVPVQKADDLSKIELLRELSGLDD